MSTTDELPSVSGIVASLTIPSDPAPPRERCEALLAYAKEAYDEEHRRYEWTEVKTARYLTILTIVLGVNAVRVPELAAIGTKGDLQWSFLIAYAVGFGTGLGALVAALRALRFEDVPGFPIGDDMVDVFTVNTPDYVLLGFAKRYLSAARELRLTNGRRFGWANRAYRYLAVSVVASFAAVALYIALKAQGIPL
jgi:hypothetical protein